MRIWSERNRWTERHMETVTPEDMPIAPRNRQRLHAVHAEECDRNRETAHKYYLFSCPLISGSCRHFDASHPCSRYLKNREKVKLRTAGKSRRDHSSPANTEGGRKWKNLVTGWPWLDLFVILNVCNSDPTNETTSNLIRLKIIKCCNIQ